MNINKPSENIALPGRKKQYAETDEDLHKMRKIPIVNKLPKTLRNHLVAAIGEFVGTFMFLFFAFSTTQVANTTSSGAAVSTSPNTSNLLYVALGFGFSLAVNAWVFFRITGGLFNPAVTFGMCLIGAVPWIRGGIIVFSQLLGGIAAAAVVSALFPGPEGVRTSLGGGTSIVQGLFIEMFLTAELVFTIFMLAAEKHKGTFIAPVGIGLSLFIAELTGVYFTGGSLNPARSFGPAVVARRFNGYHWIYWVGPALGSLVAVGFYKLVKMLEYETVNPGADMTTKEAEELMEELAERDLDHTNSGGSGLDDAPSTLPNGSTAGVLSQARQNGPLVNSHLSRPPPPMVNESFARIANPRSNSSFLRASRPAAPPAPVVQQSVEYRNARPENSSIDTVVEGRNGVVPLYAGKNDNMV